MKPSFALDFRDGVIALLHRTSRGWQQVGTTPLDAPDLPEALNYLRATALGLSPRGLTTKLVIPNDQVMYTQVYAPGPEAAKRRRQVRAAIDGLTPYALDDLVFDWWGTGPEVQVAIVAKETLTEAEAFATEHRLNPVAFVAVPENGAYLGEPFFGPSTLAATLLATGEKIERDQDPISVVAREFPHREPPAPEPPESAPVVAEPVTETIASEPQPAEPPPAEPPPAEAGPAAPVDAAQAATEPEPAAEPAVVETAAVAADPDGLPDFRAAILPPAGAMAFDPRALAVDLVDEAPMAVDVSDDLPPDSRPVPPGEPSVVSTDLVAQTADDVPVSPATEIIAAFASRRTAAIAAGATKSTAASGPHRAPNLGPAPGQRPSVPRPTMARPAAAPPVVTRSALPFPAKTNAAKPGAAAKSGKGNGSALPAPGLAGAQRERNVVPMLPTAASAPPDVLPPKPAAKAAPKGRTGLDGRPMAQANKPRYLGLILTGILLLLLALVAAWSSYFLSANNSGPNAIPATESIAALPPPAAAPTAEATLAAPVAASDQTAAAEDPQSGDLPTTADEALADGQDPTAPDQAAADQAAADQAAADQAAADQAAVDKAAADQAAADQAAAEAAKPEPAPATQISTDLAPAGTPGTDPQDEIFLAAADTPPDTTDPLALPQVMATGDPAPDAAPPPPPFGTVYQFDADGRIKPTPEGIITPEGVLLIAGKPKLVPPTRPAASATAAAVPTVQTLPDVTATLPTVDQGSTAAAAAGPVFSDPALAGKKPRARPAGLTTPTVTVKQGEDLAMAPGSRFASLRPQARPRGQTTAATATTTAAAASLAANGVQPVANSPVAASQLAVAVSLKPAARPSGLDRAVEAAVAAAVKAPAPEPQVQDTVTASAAPEVQAEPDSQATAPRLPTNASVAKQATDRRAINTRKIALLGVFGTASTRYAMVRQPGGGVKKVKVGDTIDGGRVAAITANAVQYQKGGRMLTLSLPTG